MPRRRNVFSTAAVRRAALLVFLILAAFSADPSGARAAALSGGGDDTAAEKLEALKNSVDKLTALVDKRSQAALYPKWEYLFVSANILASAPDMANLGMQGWELVMRSSDGVFIFKRRLKE